jgi:hypothetical protein
MDLLRPCWEIYNFSAAFEKLFSSQSPKKLTNCLWLIVVMSASSRNFIMRGPEKLQFFVVPVKKSSVSPDKHFHVKLTAVCPQRRPLCGQTVVNWACSKTRSVLDKLPENPVGSPVSRSIQLFLWKDKG